MHRENAGTLTWARFALPNRGAGLPPPRIS
jgi:hypothetical protein